MQLPPPWDAYARVQDKLDRCHTADDYAWGLEATLNRLLEGLPAQSIDRTVNNEGRKERHRARLRRLYLTSDEAKTDPQHALSAREALQAIMALVGASDWALLVAVAEGFTYSELAARRRVAPGTLRTKVSRLRTYLKRSGA